MTMWGTLPFDAVHDVAFFQQEFGQVGAILAGDAGDEGGFHSLLVLECAPDADQATAIFFDGIDQIAFAAGVPLLRGGCFCF